MKKAPKKTIILLGCFLLPALTAAAVFAREGICPFGSKSLGVLDMSDQYLSLLGYLRQLVSGRASALYLPGMALGGNGTGVLAYYLTSPLDLITCLFPKEELLTAVSWLFLLRVGLCGLTMGIYAGSRHGWSCRVWAASCAYGLMAYMMAYSINYLWQDSVALLPLVALGVARLTEGKRCRLYILSLAGALICSFYIGYILCIFSVLFFLGELFCARDTVRPGRALVRFALASLTAGALAAFLLVPALMSLHGGKAGLDGTGLGMAVNFSLPAFFAKLFPGSFRYEELTPVGLPNVFTGTASVMLAALYFVNRAVPRRRRAVAGALLGIVLLSFYIAPLDLVWHGMNRPTWYNYRYSFLFSFLLAAAADAELAHLREGTAVRQLWLPAAAIVLTAALAFAGPGRDLVSLSAALVSGATALCLCAGLALALRPDAAPRLTAALALALLAVNMGELAFNAQRTFDALLGACADPASWGAYVREKDQAMALADTGGSLVRVESPDCFGQDRCESLLFGYDGLSHYSSAISQKNLDFLQRMGLARYTGLYARYTAGVTAGADSFLGVGYVAAMDFAKPYDPVGSSGRYTVYQNPFALPVGFTVDSAIETDLEAEDCFGFIQGLYDAAAPEVGESIYAPAESVKLTSEGFADTGGGAYVSPDGLGGELHFIVVPAADGPLYGEMDFPGYPGVMVFVNDGYLAYYATGQTNGSLYLGDFKKGDTVAVRVQASVDVTMTRASFATENVQALAAYRDAVAPGGCVLEKRSGRHFSGGFTTGQRDSLLLLTLPYDRGWRITLDGQPVQAIEVQGCLAAIPVTAGEHTLDMRYTPPGLIPGAAVSGLAAAGCLLVWLHGRKRPAAE